MANYERDKEDVRVFDGGEDDDENEGSHLPVVIIIAILVLAAFGGVVWLAYNQGVARGRNDIPVRMAATEQSGSGGQIKVYQQPAGAEDEEDGQAAPKAAAPQPASPQATQPVQRQEVTQAAPPPVSLPSAAPKAVQPAPAAPKPATSMTPPAAKPAPSTATSAPAAKSAPLAVAQAKPQATQQQPQQPVVATKPPAQLGLAHPATEAPPAAAAKPVTTPKATATAVPPKAVTTAAPKAAAGGAYLLQIGAYKSDAEAMAAWKTYQAKHAALLSGFGPDVQRADLGDKGVWYRLRISSFSDKDAAAALCERLKEQNGACFLAH